MPLHSLRPVQAALALCLGMLAGCANLQVEQADRLAREGNFEQAHATLDAAVRRDPADAVLRAAHSRARDRVVVRALTTAELALAAGRADEARAVLERVRRIDPDNTRLAGFEAELQRARREQDQAQQRRAGAPASLAAVAPQKLGPAFQAPVTLEFRDAPLRQVFESLSRTSSINFLFDKDVRADARITTFLRGVTLDEGMKLILATQQLDRRVLNDNTVLVFPNTPAKQREHQELITRSLYLTNADVKQALTLVRTMTKTRDLHADERLNVLVVRDTPEVVAQIEKLLATIDLPDPEVTLAVEVMEVASSRIDELGASWPTQVEFGIPNFSGQVTAGSTGLRGNVANPALIASLRSRVGGANLLANPSIRARNHEKAKVQIGEKLPVFTTTSATVNVGASTTVTLLDVGLKLDIEPSVQLDGDVIIKIALEVSNLVDTVKGPNGSLAYQLGTRLSTTSLRLRDGETQVLSGLIKDEDRRSIDGLPGLSQLPLLGRLFGFHNDTRSKTEIIMLITPRVVRNLALPEPAAATFSSGTDSLPGAETLRLRRQASAGVGATRGDAVAATAADPEAAAAAPAAGGLTLSATAESAVGETVSVTLANRTAMPVKGELEVDPQMVRLASGGGQGGARVPFAVDAGRDAVLIFRVLPPAAGNEVRALVVSASGRNADGQEIGVAIEGGASTRIRAPAGGAP